MCYLVAVQKQNMPAAGQRSLAQNQCITSHAISLSFSPRLKDKWCVNAVNNLKSLTGVLTIISMHEVQCRNTSTLTQLHTNCIYSKEIKPMQDNSQMMISHTSLDRLPQRELPKSRSNGMWHMMMTSSVLVRSLYRQVHSSAGPMQTGVR